MAFDFSPTSVALAAVMALGAAPAGALMTEGPGTAPPPAAKPATAGAVPLGAPAPAAAPAARVAVSPAGGTLNAPIPSVPPRAAVPGTAPVPAGTPTTGAAPVVAPATPAAKPVAPPAVSTGTPSAPATAKAPVQAPSPTAGANAQPPAARPAAPVAAAAKGAGPLRIAIDTGRVPAGAEGQAEFEANRVVGVALAQALLAQKVVVTRVPGGLSPAQRAMAAAGTQLLVSVNHEVMKGTQRDQAASAVGYTVGLSGRAAHDAAQAQACARDVGLALAAAGRTPAPATLAAGRPVLDAKLGVQRQDDLAVLNQAPVPALRVQVALLANPADASRLQDAGWVKAQAQAIAKGLVHCLESAPTTAAPAGPGTPTPAPGALAWSGGAAQATGPR